MARIAVVSGEIVFGKAYLVEGTGAILYNAVTYTAPTGFTGGAVNTFTISSGTPDVYEKSEVKGEGIGIIQPLYFPLDKTQTKGEGVGLVLPTSYSDKTALKGEGIGVTLYNSRTNTRRERVINEGITAKNLILNGNSFIDLASTTPNLTDSLNPLVLKKNYWIQTKGQGGIQTWELTANIAAWVTPIMKATYAKNIVVFLEIGNNINAGASAATALANVVTYCTAVKAATPTAKIIVITAFPRNFSSVYVTKEAIRISVNSSILSYVSPPWDAVVDLTLDPDIGAVGAWSNTTYYHADGIHLIKAGQDKLAVLVNNVIDTV